MCVVCLFADALTYLSTHWLTHTHASKPTRNTHIQHKHTHTHLQESELEKKQLDESQARAFALSGSMITRLTDMEKQTLARLNEK